MTGKIFDQFERFLQSRKISPPSIRAYSSDLHAFITWFEKTTGEAFSPASIVRRDMVDWRDGMRPGLSPATVNRRLSSLRIFYLWAQREGLTSLNPMVGLQGINVPVTVALVPEKAIETLLAEARRSGNLRDRAMLELLADTGMRVTELARLQRSDLQLTGGQAWISVPTGSDRKRRRLLIRPRARLAIHTYLEKVGELPADDPLFSTRKNTPLSPFVIWYTVRKHANLAGLGDLCPRQLRSAATRRLVTDLQVGLVGAARLLGQERMEMLVKYLGEIEAN